MQRRKVKQLHRGLALTTAVTTKRGTITELVNVIVLDDTAEATLALWGAVVASVDTWVPSLTVLLITYPNLSTRTGRPSLSLNANTHVDIDPDSPDAKWLRNFTQKQTRREHVNPAFPDTLFDLEATLTSQVRILYNLADIDATMRTNPGATITGFLSAVVMDIPLHRLYLRNMLLCEEHCGVPLFANTLIARCKQCEAEIELRINPKVVGAIIDETGCIANGKLLWSDRAWEDLLGRTKAELVRCGVEVIKYLEHRIRWLRVTLVFGAGPEECTGGRVCVLGVKE